MDNEKLTMKTASYPLGESAPLRLKIFVAITPMFYMLAMSV